jgi:hypothetical protein
MGFQAMSHRRDGNAAFLGCSGYVSLSGIIRTLEIAALPSHQHVKKENTSVKFSTRMGLRCAAHWANNCVKYSQ